MANAVVRVGEVPRNAALEESASLVMNITRNAYQDQQQQQQQQLRPRLQATLNQLPQQTTTMPVVKTVLPLAIGIVVNQVALGQAKLQSQAQ